MVPNKLKDWIRRHLFNPRSEGPCLRFSVRHIGTGKTDIGNVDSMDVPKSMDEVTEDFADAVAVRMYESAQNDANGLSGLQSYSVCAFFAEEPNKVVARYTLRLQSEVEEGDGSGDESQSEPATSSGLTAQSMRHTEAIMRMSVNGTMATINGMQRQIEAKDKIIEELSRKQMEQITMMEELHSRKHERDMDAAREARTYKMQGEFIDRITPLLPVVMAKLTGVKMLAGGAGVPEGIKGLMQSITPEQFEKLNEVLKPEQVIALTTMMGELAEAEETQKKKLLEANNVETNKVN